MHKDIIINSSFDETRIALLEDGTVVELFVEREENGRTVGDIHLGKVVNVVKGMRAAFIDIGQEQDAFLHFSDVGDTILEQNAVIEIQRDPRAHGSARDRGIKVTEGQGMLVQITKEPISTKGSRITTQISVPGRYLVLVPHHGLIGVSKKIANYKERRRLRSIVRELRPEGFGVIVRTVAEGKGEDELKSDIDQLVKTWRQIENKARRESPPALLYKDMAMTSSIVRDLFKADVRRLVIDNRKMHREILSYCKAMAPSLVPRISLYTSKRPVFDQFGIEVDIERSLSRKVWLRSGGYLIFDHTEAMVTIDINSGKYMGRRDHEQNTLKVNLEAAREVARQLRLRDMGGLIVIDFIDMVEAKNRKRLFDEFRRELRKDRAQTSVLPPSDFGIVEMTRERIRPSLLHSFSEACPSCGGTGRVISKGTIATKIERWVKRYRLSTRDRSLTLIVNPEMVEYLTHGIKSRIRQIMWRYWSRIEVEPDDRLKMDEFRFISKKSKKDVTDDYMADSRRN